MKNVLTQFVNECLHEIFAHKIPKTKIIESTARIFNLSKSDIVRILDDILSGEPALTYTEKVAGTFFEVKIAGNFVGGMYKDMKMKGVKDYFSNHLGVASVIKHSGVFSGQNIILQFEMLAPNEMPDYIDYAIGNKPLAIEVTGKMTVAQAAELNKKQNDIKFMSQTDIIKRPKQLSPELRSQLEKIRTQIGDGTNVSVDEKKKIEALISSSLADVFGESVLGGRIEGLFVTGAEKQFKIPDKEFADMQRLHAPLYAMLSDRGKMRPQHVLDRLRQASGNADKVVTDKIVGAIRAYLEAAAGGSFKKGFKTFFNPEEAKLLLQQFNKIIGGDDKDVSTFVALLKNRVANKLEWVRT